MIGVVVVHYAAPRALDLVLTALEDQGVDLRVVVADDGSPTLPVVGERPYPVQVVSQEDRGFRAAAARNLGARTLLADGSRPDALCFLDGDTIPTPGYLAALTATLAETAADAPYRRALVVGRRRYADLAGMQDAPARAMLDLLTDLPGPRVLPDPAWLEQGYAATENLRAADDRSYRFVISSVLALTPELFSALEGFDESFVGYGGEDWDLAHRAWLAGADLRHEPRALAWHDGPDAAGRDEIDPDGARERKNRETVRLARTVTDPAARDAAVWWDHPAIAVTIDDAGMPPEDVLLTCADLLRGGDTRVWLSDGLLLRDGWWPADDPRVQQGPLPRSHAARARHRVHLSRAVRLSRPLPELCDAAPLRLPGLRVDRTRDLARGTAPPPEPAEPPAFAPDRLGVRAARPQAHLDADWGWLGHDSLPALTDPPEDPR